MFWFPKPNHDHKSFFRHITFAGKLSKSFRTSFNKWFVHCTFLLFRSKHHVGKFKKNYLNKQKKNITFKSEIESVVFRYKNKAMKKKNKFVISVYRKPAFSYIFKNFEIFEPDTYKRTSFETVLHRSFRLWELSLRNSNFEVKI